MHYLVATSICGKLAQYLGVGRFSGQLPEVLLLTAMPGSAGPIASSTHYLPLDQVYAHVGYFELIERVKGTKFPAWANAIHELLELPGKSLTSRYVIGVTVQVTKKLF